MKDSGLSWIKDIPNHWRIMPNKYVMNKLKEIQDIYKDEDIISLSIDGVKVRDLEAGGKMPTTFDGYQRIKPNRLLMCLFDIDVTPRCIGIIKDEGLTSPAYSQFVMNENGYAPYFYYYYLNLDFDKTLVHLAKNLRHSLTEDQLGAINVIVPPYEEQRTIADYLDKKTSEIDAAIKEAQELIEKYKAYKQSIITEIVTKGLNPNVTMKDSGVEWIGEIPEGWSKCRLKYLCEITTGNEDTQNADPDGEYPFYVRSPQIERCKRYTFDGEGILIAGDGAGAGRIFHHVYGKYAVHQRVYRLYNFKIHTSYLHYYLSSIFPNEMDRGSAQSTVPSMRLPMLLNFNILIPSNSEQQFIVNLLDEKCSQIDSIISKKENLISQLQEYRKSIIFEYVTGKKEVPNG